MAAPVASVPLAANEVAEETDLVTNNDALLLKTLDQHDESDAPVVTSVDHSVRMTSRPWWRTWFRRSSDRETVQVVRKTDRDHHSDAGNHQNNYVSVNLSPPEGISRRDRSASEGSYRKRTWRTREKWLLLFLMLVTIACLAFVAISLVSILRQGQGKHLANAL